MNWKAFEGYDERHLLIDGDECIVGEVSGSKFRQQDGWAAIDTSRDPVKRIGRYLTLEAAKRAVEKAVWEDE